MNKKLLLLLITELLGNNTEDDEVVNVPTVTNNPFIGKYVLVRGYDAGVRAGKLIDDKKGSIILEDARMLWRRWTKEWIGLSWIAEKWLDETKKEVRILETHKKIVITDDRVSLFFECTKAVEKQIRNYPVAERS